MDDATDFEAWTTVSEMDYGNSEIATLIKSASAEMATLSATGETASEDLINTMSKISEGCASAGVVLEWG